MLAMDVDGVLTDAGMYYSESGDEPKKFHCTTSSTKDCEPPDSPSLCGDSGTVSTPEIRVDCPDDVKFHVVEEARKQLAREHKLIDIDEVRVLFSKDMG